MEQSEVEKIARTCATKILQWRNRRLIADMCNVHLNTMSRFLSGGEVTVGTLVKIELAVNRYQKSLEYANQCFSCED